MFNNLLALNSDSRASASTVQQGRSHIVDRLLELGTYEFSPRGVRRDIYYDLAALSRKVVGGSNQTGPGGVLAALHAEIVNPNLTDPSMDHVLTLDQSFVLRRKVEDDVDVDEATRTPRCVRSIFVRTNILN